MPKAPFFSASLLALALAFTHAAAADAETTVEARTAFRDGAELAAEHRWAEARDRFLRSATLRPHATTTYNLAFCERALGHATRARQWLFKAKAQDQASAGAELTPELRADAEKLLVELEGKIARPAVTISPPGTRISIDGRPLTLSLAPTKTLTLVADVREPGAPEAPPNDRFVLEIDEGDHEVVLTPADQGTSRVLQIHLSAASHPALLLELPPPVASTVDVYKPRRIAGLTITGVGVATMIVGGVFAWSAASNWSAAKAACPNRPDCPDEQGSLLSNTALRRANVATALIVTGAIASAGGLVIYLASPRPNVAIGVGPGASGSSFGLSFLARF